MQAVAGLPSGRGFRASTVIEPVGPCKGAHAKFRQSVALSVLPTIALNSRRVNQALYVETILAEYLGAKRHSNENASIMKTHQLLQYGTYCGHIHTIS